MEYSEAFEPASVFCQIVVASVKLEDKVEGAAYNRGISLRLPESSPPEMHPKAKQPNQKRDDDSRHSRGLESSLYLETLLIF